MHKFVIGFSVVSVITAVFIQETFKIAGSDDIMLNNQERLIKLHEEKMTELFTHADEDGDGSLDRAAFMEVMGEPVVKHWLASLGFRKEDAGLVFDVIQSFRGKQEVTASELVKGAASLKGSARHIDLIALITYFRHSHKLLKQLSEQLLNPEVDHQTPKQDGSARVHPALNQDDSAGVAHWDATPGISVRHPIPSVSLK